MKKRSIILLVIIFLFISVAGLVFYSLKTLEDVHKSTLELIKKYSPDSYHIVSQIRTCPDEITFGHRKYSSVHNILKKDIMEYIEDLSQEGILENLHISIHELCHEYQSTFVYYFLTKNYEVTKYDVSKKYYLYYINSKESVLTELTDTFPSKEMADSFPYNLKTGRFKRYISPSSEHQSTQVYGVYALTNELNAYYQGMKMEFNLLPYYKNVLPQTAKNWSQFFNNMHSNYNAYPEFKLYILRYLMYAQNKHPDIYEKIMQNKNFIKAFLKIDENYAKLNENFFKAKYDIFEYLKKSGFKVKEDNGYLYITDAGKVENKNAAASNNLKTYNILKEELNKTEYKQITDKMRASL